MAIPRDVDDRLILYLDVLGFKDIFDRVVNDVGDKLWQELVLTLEDGAVIAETALQSDGILSGAQYNNDIAKGIRALIQSQRTTCFSDTIIVSFAYSTYPRVALLCASLIVQLLSYRFAKLGRPLRGSIAIGKLHHTDKLVLGDALIDAYLMEQSEAIYPRVIVSRTLVDVIRKQYPGRSGIDTVLKKDSDGWMYVDVIGTIFQSEGIAMLFPDVISVLSQMIMDGLKSGGKSVTKYRWLAERFNEQLSTEHASAKMRDISLLDT